MRNLANAVGCFALAGIAPRPMGDETLNTHSRARFAQHRLHLTNAHINMALDSVCTMVRSAQHRLHLTNAHINIALDSVCTMVRFARF